MSKSTRKQASVTNRRAQSPIMSPNVAAYARHNLDAIAEVCKTPFPADCQFIPFYRHPDHQEKSPMPDQQQPEPADPVALNAARVTSFANEHRPSDVLLDRPQDGVVTLPSTVKAHERDLNGNTTYLQLGR